jgi:hypothetical protein
MIAFQWTPTGIQQRWNGVLRAEYPFPDDDGICHTPHGPMNLAAEILSVLLPPGLERQAPPRLVEAFKHEALSKLPREWTVTDGDVMRWYVNQLHPAVSTGSAVTRDGHTRKIPSDVRVAVWARDGGRCAKCESTQNLHFDHIIPFSKGGSSSDVNNIQILCARCNQKKRDLIQ